MRTYTQQTWGFVVCVALVLSAGAFLLYHLGQEPLQDYDEATYAEVVHEALASHHYLSYTEGGVNYFKKPPLMFWAMEASESTLGETAFAVRLPFVLSGVLLLVALMLLIYELAESWWPAALGGAVLATTGPFMETARQVRFDTAVIFFIVLAVYFFIRGLKDPRWLAAFGVAVGLAAMAKSVIALFAFVAAFSILLLYRRFDLFVNKYTYSAAATFFAVAAPWHVWEWAQFGNAFWQQYIGIEVLNRTQQNLFWTVTISNADYINYLQQFTQPWLGAFLIVLAATSVWWTRVGQPVRRFVAAGAATIAFILVVFFLAKTKAPTYLLPVYPFAAAIIALGVASIRGTFWRVAAGIVFAILFLSAAHSTYYNAYHINPYYSIELAMAKDEQVIGKQLAGTPHDLPVYVYDDENLESVQFYSQHFYWPRLTATSTPAAGSFIIVDSNGLQLLAQNFPEIRTRSVFSGPQVSLVTVEN